MAFASTSTVNFIDTQGKTTTTINNQDLGHIHGQCIPMKALNGKMVDAIVVGGIGAGAITGLNKMGIKVYKASMGSIQDNIRLFEADSLVEMTMSHSCGSHIGGCAH